MSARNIIIALAAILVVGAAITFFRGSEKEPARDADQSAAATSSGTTSSGARVEENAIFIGNQRPKRAVVASSVFLASPGYVVIHEIKDGKPGAILGSSSLLPAGQSDDIEIELSRATRNGETLAAMLHSERDGDSKFSEVSDVPVQSRLGGPLHGLFEISSDAPTTTEAVL